MEAELRDALVCIVERHREATRLGCIRRPDIQAAGDPSTRAIVRLALSVEKAATTIGMVPS